MTHNTMLHTLVTLADWIRWGASAFGRAHLCFAHGTDNALDEARWLALASLDLPLDLPDIYLGARLLAEEREKVQRIFEQRIHDHIPAAYLLGETMIAGLRFKTDARTLIPRSPLVGMLSFPTLPWDVNIEDISSIADIGTGSGAIAIACGYGFPNAKIDATDISAEALVVARENVYAHGMETQIHFYQGDLLAPLPHIRYDLIVSNPPYVRSESIEQLPAECRYEPRLALDGGSDGLATIHRLLHQSARFLTPEGHLLLEVGEAEVALKDAYPSLPFHWLDFEGGATGVCVLAAKELRLLERNEGEGA